MTGTDYNAIVAERNKPTATIRPKAQPDDSHIMGRNQTRLKMRTGNGDDAHLWPAKRYCDIAPTETDNDKRRNKARREQAEKQREEREKLRAANNLAAMVRSLSEIYSK